MAARTAITSRQRWPSYDGGQKELCQRGEDGRGEEKVSGGKRAAAA